MNILNKSILLLLPLGLLMACNNDPKSASGSAAAENTSAGSGGKYLITYDYNMQMPGSDSIQPAGSVSLYLSDRAVRSEIKMLMFGSEGQPVVMIGHYDQPDKTIVLNMKNKTYSMMDINMPDELQQKMAEMSSDTLIVIGKEEVDGYDCTHLKIVTTMNISSVLGSAIGDISEPSVTEYWVSKDVPGASLISTLIASRPEMVKGMDASVYKYGVPVKMAVNGDTKMLMTLTKAEEQDIPDEMFEIPKDYSKEGKD